MAEQGIRIADQGSGSRMGLSTMKSVDGSGNALVAQFVRHCKKPAAWSLPRTAVSAADSINITSGQVGTNGYVAINDEQNVVFGIITDDMGAFTSVTITPVLLNGGSVMMVLAPITITKPSPALLNGGTNPSGNAGYIYGGNIDVAGFDGLYFHVTAITTTQPINIRCALV